MPGRRVGSSRGADIDGVWSLVGTALAGAGVAAAAVGEVATLDRKADEPAITALAARLGVAIRTFGAAALAGVVAAGRVPNPSPAVAAAVGTASVAEAAALLAAGQGATLVAVKQVAAGRDATVAVSRRARAPGHLAVVGLGPGDAALRTPAATAAVRHADVVSGYGPYVDMVAGLLHPSQLVVRWPIGAEAERCRDALTRAVAGARVALVCSGDAGVYALASLVCELAPGAGDPPLTVIPGVTAALSAAAVLGAPLGHDHVALSLSDLLTPWEVIARRLHAAAAGDFVVSLYNPRSSRRTSQLAEALAILAADRPPSTPAAVLTDIGRPGERVIRTTLAGLDPAEVGMRSLVIIGATSTRWIGARMVTPRGYPDGTS
jgi:cobalt-precorrin 5A hydrolase/precorrin-3B C17-methyltransferase